MAVHFSRLKWLVWIGLVLVVIISGVLAVRQKYFASLPERVNILVMGKGGTGHAGPDLTDTMILVSVARTSHNISLISIPRDLWIPEIRAKINSAYYWGKQKPELGGGLSLAKNLVAEVTGQRVDYAVVLDFSGFEGIINAVGGIEVNVDRSFTDSRYPIAGKEADLCGGDRELKCRYQTLHFTQGKQSMNGETALQFVRSRNGDNGENTDFAREARQQKVITALKDKILLFSTWSHPRTDWQIGRALGAATETDLSRKVFGSLALSLWGARNQVRSLTVPEDLLANPPISPRYDLQYVLVPKSGDWEAVRQWVNQVLNP